MTSKYDKAFTKIIRPDKLNQWKCNNCTFTTKPVEHTSTSSRQFHLKEKHKAIYDELESKANNERKRPHPVTPSSVPTKQLKVDDGLYRDTDDVKSTKIDNAILNMIASSNLSLSFVEGTGFQRLMKLLDARYRLRGRKFFTEEKLPERYNKLKSKIQGIISELEDFSIELIAYLNEPLISRDRTAGSFWFVNSERLGHLAKLYPKYGTAPATSAEAERLFSIAGLVLSDLRKRLSDGNVKMLLFLSCNLKLVNYEY